MAEKKLPQSQIVRRVLKVLKSRQMIVAVSTVFVALLILAIPELKAAREELLTLIVTLALAAIGNYTIQDAAQPERQTSISQDEIRELMEDVLSDMIEESVPSEGDEEASDIDETQQWIM